MILINLFFILLGVYFICTHIKADRMSDRVMILLWCVPISINLMSMLGTLGLL